MSVPASIGVCEVVNVALADSTFQNKCHIKFCVHSYHLERFRPSDIYF